ncbi:beta-lactamase/transpeptidase-like protein [Panaeolus papilionaceus]|nr:beta-lactamase/transpeptidase-like protein [Panaeolus papilionaceus]
MSKERFISREVDAASPMTHKARRLTPTASSGSIAVLKVIDLGKLSYDTPVGDYLPAFKNPVVVDRTSTLNTTFKPAQTTVTVKHLLNFSSGLFYPVIKDDLFSLPMAYTSKEVHAAADPLSEYFKILLGPLPGVPLKFEPGTDFIYGWSSDMLGFLVEKVSGQNLEQFCKTHFFDPLGMKTSFHLTPELKKRLVELSFRNENGELCKWNNQITTIEHDPSKVKLYYGGIGIYTSMRDYLKLLRHILQIKTDYPVSNPILKKETVETMFTPALTGKGSESLSTFIMMPGLQWSTALAVCTEDWPERRRKGTAFWGGWAGTEHFIDPTTGIAMVFGIQVAPTRDIESLKLKAQMEAVLYAALEPSRLPNRL